MIQILDQLARHHGEPDTTPTWLRTTMRYTSTHPETVERDRRLTRAMQAEDTARRRPADVPPD